MAMISLKIEQIFITKKKIFHKTYKNISKVVHVCLPLFLFFEKVIGKLICQELIRTSGVFNSNFFKQKKMDNHGLVKNLQIFTLRIYLKITKQKLIHIDRACCLDTSQKQNGEPCYTKKILKLCVGGLLTDTTRVWRE